MSGLDARLRELERRWRETGALDDEARWLQERARGGELREDRLELAAALNHPAAAAALGRPLRPPPSHDTIDAWVEPVIQAGREATFRAGLAEARLHEERVRSRSGSHEDACATFLARRCDPLEDWVLSTGDASKADPRSEVPFLIQMGGVLVPPAAGSDPGIPWAFMQGVEVTGVLARAVSDQAVPALGSWWRPGPAGDELAQIAARIEEEVTAWALGTRDPLRLRLDRLEVASPCHADWDDMQGDDQERHCRECSQTVYDLTQRTREEAAALLRDKEGRACVRWFRRADGRLLTEDCVSGLQDKLEPYRLPTAPTLGMLA